MKHVVEFRSLSLRSGIREQFHRLFVEQSLPLLQRWKMDVVGHGSSLHDNDTYFVIRRFDSLRQRQQLEDDFYSSDDWKRGPREALLAMIEDYVDIVLELDDTTVAGLRKQMTGRAH